MPTLAIIGDVHTAWDRLELVLERIRAAGADGVLLVGDVACAGWERRRTPQREARWREEAAEVLRRVEALGLPLAWVPGNHDLPDPGLPHDVDGRVVDVAGLRVGGIGGAGPHRFGFAYEWSEAEVRGRPALPCDVLLCHAPPAGTALARTASGHDAGSVAIRERALAHRGFLACGHIHESPGVERLGDCLCVNAGGLGEPFGAAQVAFLTRDAAGDRAWVEALE